MLVGWCLDDVFLLLIFIDEVKFFGNLNFIMVLGNENFLLIMMLLLVVGVLGVLSVGFVVFVII